MPALALLVLSIGIVDSINPSTVAPALYLATGAQAVRSVTAFIVGVFAVNFLGGIVIALGPGQALLAVVHRPGQRVTHLLEIGLGVVLLGFALALWLGRRQVSKRVARAPNPGSRSSLLLGAGIMAVELPTALPYFAAIAAIVGSGRSIVTQILLLALFNAAFVAPLLAILVVRSLAGPRSTSWLLALRAGLDRRIGTVLPALVLVIALALIVVGAVGLARG